MMVEIENLMIGIGLLFGLALFLTSMTEFTYENFFGWLTFVNCLLLPAELLPLWSLIINILVLTFITMTRYKRGV